MNLQKMPPEERTKAAIAMVIIGASLLLFMIRMKRIIVPSAPPATAAASSPASVPTPAPSTGVATAPAGTSAVTTVASATEVLPENLPNVKVRDPFSMTAAYKGRIPDETVSKGSLPLKTTSGYSFTKGSMPFSLKNGPSALPPAEFASRSLPQMEPLPAASNREMIAQIPVERLPSRVPSLPAPSPAVEKTPEPEPVPDFVVTGTVDGEVPMAILRANNRNYLVRVGDWLENNLQVHEITPRLVALKDKTGRTHILKLGVNAHAS